MSCKSDWEAYARQLEGMARVAAGGVNGRPCCIRAGCGLPLRDDNTCVRGHPQVEGEQVPSTPHEIEAFQELMRDALQTYPQLVDDPRFKAFRAYMSTDMRKLDPEATHALGLSVLHWAATMFDGMPELAGDPRLRVLRALFALNPVPDVVRSWGVPSDADAGQEYAVTLSRDGHFACSCADWRYRRVFTGEDCKHIGRVRRGMATQGVRIDHIVSRPGGWDVNRTTMVPGEGPVTEYGLWVPASTAGPEEETALVPRVTRQWVVPSRSRPGSGLTHTVSQDDQDNLSCTCEWWTFRGSQGEGNCHHIDDVQSGRARRYEVEVEEEPLEVAAEEAPAEEELPLAVREWRVASETRRGVVHTVMQDTQGRLVCTCEDFTYRHKEQGGDCKHTWDVRLGLRGEGQPAEPRGEERVWVRAWAAASDTREEVVHTVRQAADGGYSCTCEDWHYRCSGLEGPKVKETCKHVDRVVDGELGRGRMLATQTWNVPSDTRRDVVHEVRRDAAGNYECTCEAYRFGKGRPCKHIEDVAGGVYGAVGQPAMALPAVRVGLAKVTQVTVVERDEAGRPTRVMVPLRPIGDTHFMATLVYDALRAGVAWPELRELEHIPRDWRPADIVAYVRANGRRIYGEGERGFLTIPVTERDGLPY